jgi:hypothetical protein
MPFARHVGSNVPRHNGLVRFIVGTAGLAVCLGCNPTNQPATQPAAKGPALSKLIAPASLAWSRAEACTHLGDGELGVSAAVRLVRLAELSPLCVPDELSDAHVRRLRLVPLGPGRRALGLADRKDQRRLLAPVLIAADGEVTRLAEGTEEEAVVLCVSADADVFPHLAVLPQRVLMVGEDVVPAIVLEAEENVRFDLRQERGFSYIGLVLTGLAPAGEVARYRWDPYELAFMGPAADKLPDPPGGRFQIDLKASRRLEPVGGEIPEPEPPKRPEPALPGDEWA